MIVGERCCVYPDMREERNRRLEFNTTALTILNNLEHMGYSVVTSGAFVASQATNNNKVGCWLGSVCEIEKSLLTCMFDCWQN